MSVCICNLEVQKIFCPEHGMTEWVKESPAVSDLIQQTVLKSAVTPGEPTPFQNTTPPPPEMETRRFPIAAATPEMEARVEEIRQKVRLLLWQEAARLHGAMDDWYKKSDGSVIAWERLSRGIEDRFVNALTTLDALRGKQ